MPQHTNTNRTTTRRVLAHEFTDGLYTFTEEEDAETENPPIYQLLPTGERANRVLMTGTFTGFEDETDDYVRARLVDPTGTVILFAGGYQQEAKQKLQSLTAPEYLLIIGKPNVYTPEDEDQTYASIKPEEVVIIEEETRDEIVKETAAKTIERIEAFDPDDNKYAQMAVEHFPQYGIDYREAIVNAIAEIESEDPVNEESSTPSDTTQTA